MASTVVESRSGFRYEDAARFGNAETPLCSPWLRERENAEGEKAPTERRPPKVVWEPIRLGKFRLLSVGLANGGGGACRE